MSLGSAQLDRADGSLLRGFEGLSQLLHGHADQGVKTRFSDLIDRVVSARTQNELDATAALIDGEVIPFVRSHKQAFASAA